MSFYSPILTDGLSEGQQGDVGRRRCGDVCICTADSLCYTAETNTTRKSNYTPIKMLKKKKVLYYKVHYEENEKTSHRIDENTWKTSDKERFLKPLYSGP